MLINAVLAHHGHSQMKPAAERLVDWLLDQHLRCFGIRPILLQYLATAYQLDKRSGRVIATAPDRLERFPRFNAWFLNRQQVRNLECQVLAAHIKYL